MRDNRVCFISAKGGSGKTVTSSAVGTFLAALGFKILLIDTDAATNGMTLLFLEYLLGEKRRFSGDSSEHGGILDDNQRTPELIKINDNLFLCPASFRMSNTEAIGISKFSERLNSVLSLDNEFDLIIIDAQAGIDEYAFVAAKHANTRVIVSEYDPVSAQGTDRVKFHFGTILEAASTWVLFNKILPEFSNAIGKGLSIAQYLSPLPWDVDVIKAFSKRDLAIEMESPNSYTIAISEVVSELFSDQFGDVVEQWRVSTLAEAQEPLKQELKLIEKTLSFLRKQNRYRNYMNLFIFTLTGLSFLAMFAHAVTFFENTFDKINNIPVPLLLASTTMLLTYGLDRASKQTPETDNLPARRRKLIAMIEAKESLKKASRPTGPYSRQRREEARYEALNFRQK